MSSVAGERDEPSIIWVKCDNPLVMNVIIGVTHEVEKIVEQPERRLLRPVLGLKLEHLHVGPGPRVNLRGGNFQVFQNDQIKFRQRQQKSYLGEQTIKKGNQLPIKGAAYSFL